jgi:hypothetical protein
MKFSEIGRMRMEAQGIATARFRDPAEAVAWLGAVQAQDFASAKWTIGLRVAGATEADIDRAIAERAIIRTWPMRGTLHFVAAQDVHWMRQLLTPRILAASRRRHEELELTGAVMARCAKIFAKALGGGRHLTREALAALLEKAGISASGSRNYYIFWRLAQEGLICFGIHEGKQPTFTLLEEWAPTGKARDREEALTELARRYFISHGPATAQDFAAWSGLVAAEVKLGIELAAKELRQEKIDGKIYIMAADGKAPSPSSRGLWLLPGFDEFMLGYRDRSPSLEAKHATKIVPGSNGVFVGTVVEGGRVVGTWKREIVRGDVVVDCRAFEKFSAAQKRKIEKTVARFAAFLGMRGRLK